MSMEEDIMAMEGNYDDRVVKRYQNDTTELFVSTCSVTDGMYIYETAVAHPSYNDGDMVIVEAYDTLKAAEEGHERWLKTMTADTLPEELTDCCNSEIQRRQHTDGGVIVFPRQDECSRSR